MKTLFEAFQSAALQYRDKVALIDYTTGESLTFNNLLLKIITTAKSIQSNRLVKKGDRVAILMSNQPEFTIGFFALQATGAIAVPLNYRLTVEEHIKIINDASVSGILWGLDMIESFLPLLTHVKWSVVSDSNDITQYDLPDSTHTIFSMCEWLAAGYSANYGNQTGLQACLADDAAVLIYTSGTTGQPKGVTLSHANLLEDARINSIAVEASENDIFITSSPLFHVFGLSNVMLTGLLTGATLVLVRKFNPKSILEAITRYKVTFLAAVPTMYQMMLALIPSLAYSLQSLRVCHSGAAPMPSSMFSKIEQYFGAPVQEGYGQSEASSIITSNPLKGERKPRSIGLPLEGIELQIVDDKGENLPAGETGEIRVKGKTVMLGYWNNPEATLKTIRDGWLYTSDLGYKDQDDYIYIVGRVDDMINTGGSKVYPREVEDILYMHKDVEECAVKGEISAIYNQIVVAYIIPKNKAKPSVSDLQKFCRKYLADYKVPKKIFFVQDIPKGTTGKILRNRLTYTP